MLILIKVIRQCYKKCNSKTELHSRTLQSNSMCQNKIITCSDFTDLDYKHFGKKNSFIHDLIE